MEAALFCHRGRCHVHHGVFFHGSQGQLLPKSSRLWISEHQGQMFLKVLRSRGSSRQLSPPKPEGESLQSDSNLLLLILIRPILRKPQKEGSFLGNQWGLLSGKGAYQGSEKPASTYAHVLPHDIHCCCEKFHGWRLAAWLAHLTAKV